MKIIISIIVIGLVIICSGCDTSYKIPLTQKPNSIIKSKRISATSEKFSFYEICDENSWLFYMTLPNSFGDVGDFIVFTNNSIIAIKP